MYNMKRSNDEMNQCMLRDRFDYQQAFSHAEQIHHIAHQYPAPFGVYQSPLEIPGPPPMPTHEYPQPFTGLFSPALLPLLGIDSTGFLTPLQSTYPTSQDTLFQAINAMAINTVTPPPDFAVPHMTSNSLLFNNGFPYILTSEFLSTPSPAISAMDRPSLSPRTSYASKIFSNLLSDIDAETPNVTLCTTEFNLATTAVPHVSVYESQPTKRRRLEVHTNVVRNPPACRGHEGIRRLKSDKHRQPTPRKNQQRNTRSIPQKTIFYKWIIDHIDHPFPTDKDRETLCVDVFDKKDFYWWFSNHRHRNLECSVDERGKKIYTPKLTFYKTCQRLGLDMPWPVPEDIKRQLKRTHL
ncbi:hypothetical protein H4R27_004455 [Coemansia aciculifera]|nr:hypothetical protein H4R27_004455 [Coemansia aciculifera]